MTQDKLIGVFGANGFIGKALTQTLVAQGYRVRAVARHFDGPLTALAASNRNLDLWIGDFKDPHAMRDSLNGLDTVFQLVSSASPGFGNDLIEQDITNNVIPHLQFLESCRVMEIGRLVFLSSGGTVYGRPEQVPIPETHPTNPISSYGLTKLTIEKYINMYGLVHGLDHVIVRLSNPFGPGQVFKRGQGLIPALIQRHKEGQPVMILGDGTAQRDYIYIDDTVSALVKMIDVPGAACTTLNIASGVGRSILEVVDALEDALGETLKREFVKDRKTDVAINCLDISRAKAILDWAPVTDFKQGVKKTVAQVLT